MRSQIPVKSCAIPKPQAVETRSLPAFLYPEKPTENYFSSATKYGDLDYLSGRMIDMTRNVNASVSIKRLPATNPDKIYFDLSSGAYSLLNPSSYYTNPPNIKLFNIPTDGIEMYRVY